MPKTLTAAAAINTNVAPLPRTKPLHERAMLVHVYVSGWQARKLSKRDSDEVVARHKAQAGAARVHMALLAEGALSAINIAQTNLRQYYYEQTLPWLQNGARVITAENVLVFLDGARELIDAFEKAKQELIDNYPALKEQAKLFRGGMHNENDYPDIAQLAAKFQAKVIVSPLPAEGDFRISDLDPAEIERLKSEYKLAIEAQVAESMREPFKRLLDGVATLHERIKDYTVDEQGKAHGIFRDSCFEHLRHLCALLPKLNLTNDPALESMRSEVETRLASLDPAVLRESPTAHKDAVATAAELKAMLAGYCS